MSEKHQMSFDYFELVVSVSDEGDVSLAFHDIGDNGEPGARLLLMPWDEFREVIEFAGVHGLGIKSPYVVDESEVKASAL